MGPWSQMPPNCFYTVFIFYISLSNFHSFFFYFIFEALQVFLGALTIPVHRDVIHNGIRQYLHRMVICLGQGVLQFIPVAVTHLLKDCSVSKTKTQKERKGGREDRRKGGKEEGRVHGRKEGRKERKAGGKEGGQKGGRKDGWEEGREELDFILQ